MGKIEGVLRVRPLKTSEVPYLVCSEEKGFTISSSEHEIHYGEDTFSAVLGPKTSQHDVYLTVGQPIVDSVMRGERACLFAYGQTGSGKTFSMYGPDAGRNAAKLDGAVPSICAELFRRKQDLERRHRNVSIVMQASLVEVRGNEIVDLIADPVGREQPVRKLIDSAVVDAHMETIMGTRHLTDMIERGMSRRAVAANGMHALSSRSHAFLTVYIDKQTTSAGDSQSHRTCMHLIDLAGSEKHSDGDDGAGKNINQGLLALGKVITALAKRDTYVPYRDSTLTKMLKDSLEKPCSSIVLACLNPGVEQVSETRNVLKYMERIAAINKGKSKTGILQQKRVLAAAAEIAGGTDPMRGDEYDKDEDLHRRTEAIMTKSFGSIPCRICGNPGHPLLLYIHNNDPNAKGRSSSKVWNPIVQALGLRMKEDYLAMKEKEKEKAAKDAATKAAKASADKSKHNGDKPRPNGEKDKPGDKPTPTGEKPTPSGENPNAMGDKPNPTGEKQKASGEKSKLNGEKPKPTGDKVKPNGDKVKPSGDKIKPSGDIVKQSDVKVKPSGEKVRPNGEKVKSTGEKVKPTGDKVKPTGEKVKPTGDKAQRRASVAKASRSSEILPSKVEQENSRKPSRAPSKSGKAEKGKNNGKAKEMKKTTAAPSAEELDSALKDLRWQAFLMLRSRQQELCSQVVCAMCQDPLVTVTRLRTCRHAFCQSCVESNIGYFGQCPTCSSVIDESDLMSDSTHNMVLALRYATLKTHPEALIMCQQKGETLVRTREAADRLLLEFGVARGGVRYVRVVPDMHGNHVRRGSLALGEAPPDRVIERVDLGEQRLHEPNDPSLGYAFETAEHARKAREAAEGGGEEVAAEGAVRALLTVHWVEAMAMEPLELRLRAPVGGAFFRRVLVQLPSSNLRGPPAKRHEKHEHRSSRTGGGHGGEADGHEHSRKAAPMLELEEKPVVFNCEEDGVSANGWAMYARPQGLGASFARAQASVHPAVSRRKMQAGDRASKKVGRDEKEMASKWIDRLANDSEQHVEERIGNVNAVVKALVEAAWHNDELANLPARRRAALAALGEKRPPELLIEDIADPTDARARTIFSDLCANIHANAAREAQLHESLFGNEQIDERSRPPAFFQVAIDLVNSNDGKEGRIVPTPEFLTELIRTLGKNHAYGIIADAGTCAFVLAAVLEVPTVTSFLTFRDPQNIKESMPVHRIQHPTLVVSSEKSSPKVKQAIKKLASELQQVTCPKVKLEGPGGAKELANAVVDMFRMSSWMGALSTDGCDDSAPLLTRLTGGINSWLGTRVEQQEPLKIRVARLWAKLRTAVRLGIRLTGPNLPLEEATTDGDADGDLEHGVDDLSLD